MANSIPTTGITLLVVVLLSACGLVPTWVRGSGTLTTATRSLAAFTQIDLRGQGAVILTQGDVDALTIEAEDNLLPYLETTVTNGVLRLATPNGVALAPTQPIKFYVTLKQVERLAVSGSGTITAQTLKANALALTISGSGQIALTELTATTLTNTISGSGDVTIETLTADSVASAISGSGTYQLAGTVQEQSISISGNGTVKAPKLVSTNAHVTIFGSGNVTLQAADKLEVAIAGSGDVRYGGSPRVIQKISGAGHVAPLTEVSSK